MYDDYENVTEILTFGDKWLKKGQRKKYNLSSEDKKTCCHPGQKKLCTQSRLC
jgi:hypothetical protein